jgi:hypothetical protein
LVSHWVRMKSHVFSWGDVYDLEFVSKTNGTVAKVVWSVVEPCTDVAILQWVSSL